MVAQGSVALSRTQAFSGNQTEVEKDCQRVQWITDALRKQELEALICALPPNVLMASGYWPIVGQSIAIITAEGAVGLCVPKDEEEFAADGWADEIVTFTPSSSGDCANWDDPVVDPLRHLLHSLNITEGALGFEGAPTHVPLPYASLFLFNHGLLRLIASVTPNAVLKDGGSMLARLTERKTPREIDKIRRACRIAKLAFDFGFEQIRPGMSEVEAANLFRLPLSEYGVGYEGVHRSDGFTFCMSGANGAKADAAYQISTGKPLEEGESILIHCNSYADGYWTDISRTFTLGKPEHEVQRALKAIAESGKAAVAAIKPGVTADEIDSIAKAVLDDHGFSESKGDSIGHGVGFQAIYHHARPCIQPHSCEPLQEGMVFNVEPGIYVDDKLGARHCDMVAVTSDGCEVLTDF